MARSKLTFLSSGKEAPLPMYKRHEKPTFKNQYEKDKYWDTEMTRWNRGFAGLTGFHYFYLQEIWQNDIHGNIFRPHWRECDMIVFDGVEEAKKISFDMFFMKRREFGLSSIFGGGMPLFVALTNPGSHSLITSCDKDRIGMLFNEKITIAYDRLDSDIRPARARTRGGWYIYFAEEVKDDKGKTRFEGLRSTILGKDTVENPANFEAYRAMYCFLDELFLHPKANAVRASTARCLVKGTQKIGMMILGGTCGESGKLAGPQGVEIYKQAKDKRILTVFLPGWMGLAEFMRNGWDDEKAGTEWIMREREILDKADDKTDFNRLVSDYPLTEAEALSIISDTTVLPREIVEASISQSKIIIQEPPPIMNYDLSRKEDGIVEAKPNPQGKTVILEMPQPDTEYGSGTDPIPFKSADLDRGSDYSICIKKTLAQTYVAYYSERSLYSDIVVDKAILLQDFYSQTCGHKVKTMMEMDQGVVARDKYKDKGRADLLSLRPAFLGIKFVRSNVRVYGFNATNLTDRLNNGLITYLAAYTKNIYFKRMLDEIRVYLDKNTDLLCAVRACELQEENTVKKKAKEHPRPEFREIPKILRRADGTTYNELIRVRVQ